MKQSKDEKMLRIQNAMNSLVESRNINNISIYDIASEAHMSASTIYHYYPNVESLISVMMEDVYSGFFDIIDEVSELENILHWKELNRSLEIRFAKYCENNLLALKAMYSQHQYISIKEKEAENDILLGERIKLLYEDKFKLPNLPERINIFTVSLQASDKLYQSYHDDIGEISEEIINEAIILTESYLSYYLPQYLPFK